MKSKIKERLLALWGFVKYVCKEYLGFTQLLVMFNIGYIIYFVDRMFGLYETTGQIPYELVVPVISVFGGELTLMALIQIFKKKYGSKNVEGLESKTSKMDSNTNGMNGDDSVG